jgi:tetratricopeptide (TPR) repeat protein
VAKKTKFSVQEALSEAAARLQAGDAARALTVLARCPEATRKDAFGCRLAGLIHASQGRNERALTFFERALALKADYPEALYGSALALQELGRITEAMTAYNRLLQLTPHDPTVWHNCAAMLAGQGQAEAALAGFRKALELHPGYAKAFYGAAKAAETLGRREEALALSSECLARSPDDIDALLLRGNLLYEMERPEDALKSLDAALVLAPGEPRILCNRAAALHKMGRLAEAAAQFKVALAEKPDFAEAWLGLGHVELKSLKLEEALQAFARAVKAEPGWATAHCGEALALRELGDFEGAAAEFARSLALNPDFADARSNCGALKLLRGDFEGGWEDYEFRWVRGERTKAEISLRWPEWSGEPLAGKRILVLDEAGLGDVFMLARYLPLLAARGADVVMQCRKPLQGMLRTLPTPIALIDMDDLGAAKGVDCCAWLFSLPRAFRTRAETVPGGVPYLRAEPGLIGRWAARLGGEGFKIGVCWQGNLNPKADLARSAAPADLAPLGEVAGIRLISLQKNPTADQWQAAGASVETLGDDFDAGPDAFADTAAIMSHLDLVITIDTAIAHLAGALGRPVWVALKSVPEWRWMLGRQDSPWYPTMRLFRQERRGDWLAVFRRMAREIARLPGPPCQ